MRLISTLVRASAQPAHENREHVLLDNFTSALEGPQNASDDGELLVDMYEREDAIVVRAFVAGVEPENLHIEFDGDILTIRGERAEIEEIHDDRFFHRECYWGTFSRSILLPASIRENTIRALFKNGVVYIELPKS